jgi:hypothetical protein
MKSPPTQFHDDVARDNLTKFIDGGTKTATTKKATAPKK